MGKMGTVRKWKVSKDKAYIINMHIVRPQILCVGTYLKSYLKSVTFFDPPNDNCFYMDPIHNCLLRNLWKECFLIIKPLNHLNP